MAIAWTVAPMAVKLRLVGRSSEIEDILHTLRKTRPVEVRSIAVGEDDRGDQLFRVYLEVGRTRRRRRTAR